MRQPLLSIQLYDTYDIINKKKRIYVQKGRRRKWGKGAGWCAFAGSFGSWHLREPLGPSFYMIIMMVRPMAVSWLN